MPFTVQMTGTNEIPPEVLQLLGATFNAPLQNSLYNQLSITQMGRSEDQTQFKFAKVNDIPVDIAAAELDEYEDPDSVALTAGESQFDAREYGRVVTRTARADAISGGALSRIAAQKVGRNASQTLDLIAARTLGAGTNVMFAGAGTSAGLTAADRLTPQLMNIAYNRLSKAGATKDANGRFNAMLHSDQILDLKNQVGENSWTDVWKYSNPETVMSGEMARAFGFNIIENNLNAPANQSGGTVDAYKAVFFGADALGQGVTIAPRLGIAFTDKMNRFAHYSWYALLVMGITDQNQVFVLNTASAAGVNT